MRRTAVGVVALALLAACTPTPTQPSPSPAPTVSASPTSSPPETELQRQMRLDYEAAELAYRQFLAEVNSILESGGRNLPSPAMTQTASGDYLAYYASTIKRFKQAGAQQRGEVSIKSVVPYGYSATELLLKVCEDGSSIKIYEGTKLLGKGEFREGTLTARKSGGSWKIADGDTKKVSSCS